MDRADRSAAGLAPCAVRAAAVPAVRYMEAVADSEARGAAGRDGDHAGRCCGGSAGAGVRAGVGTVGISGHDEGPGLKPYSFWVQLPRAEARCYSSSSGMEVLRLHGHGNWFALGRAAG